jgi:hypothetical protein
MVAVGSQPRNDTCRSGLIFFDIKDVSKPVRLGCAADDGYVHDAHCLVYRGPDKRYDGKDICYGYNEGMQVRNLTTTGWRPRPLAGQFTNIKTARKRLAHDLRRYRQDHHEHHLENLLRRSQLHAPGMGDGCRQPGVLADER